jgi:predicted amidohydrolase YtcJ
LSYIEVRSDDNSSTSSSGTPKGPESQKSAPAAAGVACSLLCFLFSRATAAKIFADGVMESGTAALLEPYLNRPGYRGIPNLEPKLFNRLAVVLDRAGFQIHVHAIGDYAIRMSLDALENAGRINGRRDARHHIAHLELINPQDVPRFRQLRVVANFQMLWAYADPYITKLTEPALGPERSRWLYPVGSVVKSGAIIVGGSDWSVTSMNPLEAIQVAVTRRGLEETAGGGWIPEQIVDLPTMLAAYTINGAYISHQEGITGSIEVGKAADLIVLDRNLFEVPPSGIHKVKVLHTLLAGKEVCRD